MFGIHLSRFPPLFFGSSSHEDAEMFKHLKVLKPAMISIIYLTNRSSGIPFLGLQLLQDLQDFTYTPF